ncbi:MAG: DNA internalization-related competence protein ComEC/Rec2 [Calditrichaeota bacterium]|nr:DNA internalization-related competence protein ComEC/Rec2 [Calditrichota bacterium]
MFLFFRRNPALSVFLAFALGIAVSWHFLFSLNSARLLFAVLLLSLGLIISYFWLKRFFWFLYFFFVLASGIFLGYEHFAFYKSDHLLTQPLRRAKAFVGWVQSAEYRANGKHRYVIECEQIQIDSLLKPASGKIILFQREKAARLKYGQRLLVNSVLEMPPLPSNPGEFNYRRYLNFRGIFFQTRVKRSDFRILPGTKGNPFQRRVVNPLRNKIRQVIDRNLPQPTNDVVKALILGERQDLDRRIVRQFQTTGVVHVLAISGLHVGFILLIFLTFLGFFPLSHKWRYILSFVLLGMFVALVNFKAPVVRASLMAVLYFGINLTQRRASALNILGVAGLIILIFDPDQLFQAGFQFSFAAVGGILYGYPELKKIVRWKPGSGVIAQKANRWIVQPGLVSLAAVLGTLPLTWWYYGSLQLGAVFINLLIIPLIGLLVMLAFFFVILALTGVPLVSGLAVIIHLLLRLILQVIRFFSRFDWVQLQVPHPAPFVIFLTVLFILLLFRLRKPAVRFYALGILLLILIFVQPQPLNRLRVTFIDVGQGDACVVQLPGQKVLLIDGGEKNPWRDAGERNVVPLLKYYGIKRINYVIATHAHTDHFGGLSAVLKNFTIDTLVLSPYPDSTKSFLKFVALAKQERIPVIYAYRGRRLNSGEKTRCYVLHPFGNFTKSRNHGGREVNNSSVVLKIVYGNTSFLFTGDAQKDAELAMLSYDRFLKSNVLKLGHHGSSTSSGDAFLAAVKPEFGIISVGKNNKFSHPSPKVLRSLRQKKIPSLRTDRLGAVVFESDGQGVNLINWRLWLN